MGINSFGFETPSGASGPQLSRTEGLIVGAGLQLPPVAEKRLTYLQAHGLIANGHRQAALSDARGDLQNFRRKIEDAYHEPWDKLKDSQGFKGSSSYRALASELSRIQRDLAVAEAAQAIYASDTPISRRDSQVLSSLASECVGFVNRVKIFKSADPVTLSKDDTPKGLQSALADAVKRIDAAERAWPPFEAALASVKATLDSKAKLPSVAIHERLTPERAPRALPVSMTVSTFFPEAESLHSTGPGSQFLLMQPDALGILIALHRPEIEAHLKGLLEKQYEAAKAKGVLFLGAAERKKALEAAKASKLLTERKLAESFWQGRSKAAEVFTYESDPRAVLGVE